MATYEYQTDTGEVIEVQQSMTETPYTHRTETAWLRLDDSFKGQTCVLSASDGEAEDDGELARPVKRLISASSGGFRLVSGPSGGWSSTGYSKNAGHRQAEAILGRPLHKPVG